MSRGPTNTTYACGTAAALSLVAVADWPYGFYTLLRLVVFAACVIAVLRFLEPRRPGLIVLAIGIGLLFNPIIRVHLDKDVWRVLNIAAAAAMGWLAWVASATDPAGQGVKSESGKG